MANQELVQNIKKISGLARAGNLDEAYIAYRALFGDPAFATYRPAEQRQALVAMIYAKGVPANPTPQMIEAHRAAMAPLSELVSIYLEPGDHEMLGMCQVIVGDMASAADTFRAGLALERARNPQSDLCGALMKRIALL